MTPMQTQTSKKLTAQLQAILRRSGRSLGEMARATGIDTSALSRFVRGERGLSMEGLDVLGDFFGLRLVARRPKGKKGG